MAEDTVLQEEEVRTRTLEENRLAGVMPIFKEKVVLPAGFLEGLFDENHKESFLQWNLLRKSKTNILSITLDRKEGVLIEQARSSRDVNRLPGQCRDLLYGNKRDCESAWGGIDRKNSITVKIDVRQPYVSAIGSATDPF